MPTSVNEAFAAAGLDPMRKVKWGARPDLHVSGVYVVSLTESVGDVCGTLPSAPMLSLRFDEWKLVCPDLTLDGMAPTQHQLMDRVARFWLPDEVILYIGLASASVFDRVGDFYSTSIGARSPHSGGYFLKLLSNLNQLWVHYAPCNDPTAAEASMLEHFAANVSKASALTLHDTERPMPFANLEIRVRKRHGIKNARRKRRTKGEPSGKLVPAREAHLASQYENAISPSNGNYRTQPVTAKDREGGRIRIPSTTKFLFPSKKAEISVNLKETRFHASWDPRTGPDRERSGVIRVSRDILRRLVDEDRCLSVSVDNSGTYLIG